MSAPIIVRFTEHQAYDITHDAEVCRFMATTSSGSYWADVFVEGPRSLRADREEFKSTVVELIQAGSPPQYIELNGELQ